MAKSIAVERVATKIGENYTHIKYTYVYTNGNSTVNRKTVVKRDDLKGTLRDPAAGSLDRLRQAGSGRGK